jgi:hypothetical protein
MSPPIKECVFCGELVDANNPDDPAMVRIAKWLSVDPQTGMTRERRVRAAPGAGVRSFSVSRINTLAHARCWEGALEPVRACHVPARMASAATQEAVTADWEQDTCPECGWPLAELANTTDALSCEECRVSREVISAPISDAEKEQAIEHRKEISRGVFFFELGCYKLLVDDLYVEAAELKGVDPPVGVTDWAALEHCLRNSKHAEPYAKALAWTWSADMELDKSNPDFDFHRPWDSQEGASLVQVVHEIVGDNPFEVDESSDEPIAPVFLELIAELGRNEEPDE